MTAHDDPCVHCGYDEENCICDDEDFMDNLDCTHCGGTGECDDMPTRCGTAMTFPMPAMRAVELATAATKGSSDDRQATHRNRHPPR